MDMGLSTGTGQGDTLWGPAIGSSRGDHPWGLPTGPGRGGVGQRQPGWGQKHRPSPSPSHCRPGDPSSGDNGNITIGVLGCSGWGVLSADRTPLPGRFCSFLSWFTFTFSQKPLPATCKLCHPQPPSRLPPTPFLSSPWFPFRMANVSVGFLDPHPPDPVPGGCWLHTDLCPPHQNCCRWDPTATSAPQFGPGGHLGVSPSQAVQLRLPRLTLLWGQSDAVLGMACYHPGDSVPPPQGRRGPTPGTA